MQIGSRTTSVLSASLIVAALLTSGCSNDAEPVSSIEVASKGAQGAALSPTGEWAAIGAIHQGGSLWRTNTSERLFNWNHRQDEKTTIVAADFSPDGTWAITADPHTLVLWNVATGQPLRFWTSPGEVLSVALSNSTSNGVYALLGLSDHSAVIFNVDKGRISRTFSHQGRVRSVDLSDDMRYALTGSEDFSGVELDQETGEEVTRIDHGSAILWDVRTGKEVSRVTHADDVKIVSLSPDGKRAFSAGNYDKALVWNTEDGSLIDELPIWSELFKRGLRFTSARFSESGKQLLTGRPDQLVQLWDIQTGQPSGENIKEAKRWRMPKRKAWKPTSASVIALSFNENDGGYRAVASNGFIHTLK